MGILKQKKPTFYRIKQAYRQAPWRLQMQSIGFYLLPVIAIALTTIIYLNISAQAATAGLHVRDMRIEEETLQRSIANQRTHLAWLTSYPFMFQRAQSLGYSQLNPADATYIVIPGYSGRQVVLMAPPPGSEISKALSDPRYQQSLLDWMSDTFFGTTQTSTGGTS
jgi:hypothetical protein